MGLEAVELLRSRRSVRAFERRQVEDKVIREILGDAIMSPSAGNLQPWKIYVVKNDDVKRKLVEASYWQSFVGEAPVVVVVVALPEISALRYGERGRNLYSIQDTSALTTYILLSAKARGLDSCWVGAFSEEKVRTALGLKKDELPVAIIPIGYGAESPKPPARNNLDKVVVWI